jgi:NitT/TauT family transport system substrate-binding protein
MFNLKARSRISILALAALAVIVFSGTGCKRQEQAGPPEKLTIAYITLPHASLVHIAFAKGFFSAEGLDVTPQSHEFGKPALNSLLEGKADLATPADAPIMFAVTGGKSIYVIAVIATSKKASAIIARKDRGIVRPSDLRGKKIGLSRGTLAEFFMDSFLSTHGMDRKEVKVVDLKPHEMPDALARGRVDALSIWQPVLKNMEKALGNSATVFYDETIYSDILCIASGQEFAKKHPETVRKVLRALIRAESFMKQNTEESLRIIAEATKTDKELLGEILQSFDFRVTLDQTLVVSLEDQTRWAQRNKLTGGAAVPNYLDFIYFDGLNSVKPDAVKIIR